MKKILLLLLLSVYGCFGQTLQNPSYGTVKITNNTVSTTAPFIGALETNGAVNKINKADLIEYLEYTTASALPVTGVVGKIYCTKDDNKLYRWTGLVYQEVSPGSGSYTETDPIVKAINGIVKSNGTTISAASAGDFPTLNQNTTGTAGGLSANITQSQVTGLVSDLALKAPLASPTFTGTVSGITKTMVGLGNVDNISDANKPVSTATQSALDLKENTSNKSDSYTVSSSTTYASTKALVDGLTSVGGSTDISGKAEIQGTILYHLAVWTNAGSLSISGNVVTGTGTSFSSSMVGARLTADGVNFIITSYSSSTVVSVDLMTAGTVPIANGDWAIYSKAFEIKTDGSVGIFDKNGVLRYFSDADGFVVLGNTTSINTSGKLTVHSGQLESNGFVSAEIFQNYTVYTYATLPTPSSSVRVYASISDGVTPVYMTAAAGGGSTQCSVYWNGTLWLYH